MLPALPPTFVATRDSLRALACYVLSPARKARTGRIGLRSYEGGIATPPFDDGARISVRGDQLHLPNGEVARLTTIAAAASLLGVELSDDPGVGHDLPPFEPHADLVIDRDASLALGVWYSFAQRSLDDLGGMVGASSTVSEGQLWPEHFDLAAVVSDANKGAKVNVGFSPGDRYHADPYVYVGPHDVAALDRGDAYWNAPFGAVLPYGALSQASDPEAHALRFVGDGLARLHL